MGVAEHGSSPAQLRLSSKSGLLGLMTVQFSCLTLLLHYTRVMPVPGGRRYLPSTAVFLTEICKLAICLTVSLYEIAITMPRSTPATSLFSALVAAVFTGDSWMMAIPASLYTLANSLQYVGISNLDAATFQVTYQLKIIVTAIFSVALLKRSLSPRQWASLILLMVGVATVSIPNAHGGALPPSGHAAIYLPRSLSTLRDHFLDAPNAPLAKRSATYEGIEEDELALSQARMSASIGLFAVVGVCICSGLGGVYFEKVIKDGPQATSLWIRNVQVSIYSLFPAFFIGVIFLDGETMARNGFFDGYNGVVVASILLQAFGGIVAAFCIFYADNISKNFATSISMVLSSLASFFFFDLEATGNFVLGTSVVLLATYLYSSEQDSSHRPPPIRIQQSTESPLRVNIPEREQKELAIKLPTTPLKVEEGLSTSRPSSPGQRSKRKGDSPGYFTQHLD